MKFFYDTEFLEDGKTIDLISIGIVREDGTAYYAVNSSARWDLVMERPWLVENVVPHLPPMETWTPHSQIAKEVRAFLVGDGTHTVELWADYGAYDHVVLMQLWGAMIDKPEGIPMWTHDLQRLIEENNAPYVPEQDSSLHNALADAWHLKRSWDFIHKTTDGRRR